MCRRFTPTYSKKPYLLATMSKISRLELDARTKVRLSNIGSFIFAIFIQNLRLFKNREFARLNAEKTTSLSVKLVASGREPRQRI